ncbi:hypothetical protein K490DRAFT_38364 [Saccharata proteae CBS 121410]|uniref:1-phosphatidylinositol-3-phosphate 5-kinase n=1 Tax=Saccharata proteae CBS 121410 TaxID=1314787 RepID=A0A6A5YC98_9PEZI|nr:hypothetical protein K490DRAFT_38364 [Saccharata proteae CBS 121410]
MPSKPGSDAPSPSTSTLRLSLGPLGRASRRGSIASLSSRTPVDKEVLSQALDQIHTSASRSESLTTFDQFASPPSASSHDSKGITSEIVQGGLSGLYNRFRASVGRGSDNGGLPPSSVGNDSGDDASIRSFKIGNKLKPSKSIAGTTVSSPVVLSSPVSRLQSPLVPSFQDRDGPTQHVTSVDEPTASKLPGSGTQSPLNLQPKAKPSLAPTPTEHAHGSTYDSTRRSSNSTMSSYTERSARPQSDASRHNRIGPTLTSRGSGHFRPGSKSRVSEDDDTSISGDDDLVLVNEPIVRDAGNTLLNRSDHSIDRQISTGPLPPTRRDSQDKQAPTGKTTFESSFAPHIATGSISSATTMPPYNEDPAQTLTSPQRPPLIQIGPSHLPGYRPSRSSSSDGFSSVVTVAPAKPSAAQTVEEHATSHARNKNANSTASNKTLAQMRRRVLSKEFWMRDENAKDCFYCGEVFSTFRRKHHCRTCGQIFDAKCTSLVSGKPFGQSGSLRVCKTCEAIINGNDDDSSDYSEDADQSSLVGTEDLSRTAPSAGSFRHDSTSGTPHGRDHTKIGTPTMGIPTSRKVGEKKRRSAVIEFNAGQSILPRPSSSRSLRSLNPRPLSSSHKRHHSRHQHMRSLKSSADDRAPFHRHQNHDFDKGSTLPAFHNDSIIDPDLAQFMSDNESSDDDQPNIFTTLSNDSQENDNEKNGLGSLLSVIKKGKPKAGDRTVGGLAVPNRENDGASITSKHIPRHTRRRNASITSIPHVRPSPRRSKSNSLLKGFGINLPSIVGGQAGALQMLAQVSGSGSKMVRSSSMQGEHAPAVELNRASLQHVRNLLRQMLQDAAVEKVSSWEKALIPILLRCTDDVNPDVQRNDDIDIRHYIKLKKIPGGRPGDTSYISGVVFTKNVALKSMPRSIPQPRVLIVTFAIEYARHQQHFMSLEPVIKQEHEFLRNLVGRIAALQPHVLLVERNVSGLALQYLEEASITVVYNVKSSVLNAVARCLQVRMITSIDKLATDPSTLGQCASFDVKTYVHGRTKKTYIYLSGCKKELGCTIVLRGAEKQALRKLKQITEFLCYVVYNLKLETCLMRDEFVLIPSSTEDTSMSSGEDEATADQTSKPPDSTPTQEGSAPGNPLRTDPPIPSFYGDVVEKHKTKILSASPFIKFSQPYLLTQAREQESRLAQLRCLRERYSQDDETDEEKSASQKFELVRPEMVHTIVEKASKPVRDFLRAVHDAEYDEAMHTYLTQKRQWETYLATNSDLFDPFTHQKIAVLYSEVNTATSTPCSGPEIISMEFYKQHDLDPGFVPDCTLGQYVEDLCEGALVLCLNGCGKRMLDHHRHYIHGEGQLSVVIEKYPSKIRGLHNTMLMWSSCRVCGSETQTIPMSESTWKYSFAKYLELSFWSTNLHPRADVCPHDIHRNHVRYFGYNNIALRIQYDPIKLYEVIVPRSQVTWKVDNDLKLKNEQYLKIEDRLDRFMSSVKARIKSIRIESGVVAGKDEECKAELEKMLKRANDEQDFLRRKLQEKYMTSRYYEIIPMNRAVRAIHERALAWDDTFSKFERTYFMAEKDIQRLAVLQLKKLFLDRDESESSMKSIEEGVEEGHAALDGGSVDEKDDHMRHHPTPSQMSPEETRHMLTSVVEQNRPGESENEKKHDPEQEALEEKVPLTNQDEDSPAVESQTEAVHREDVKHLDLAVPSSVETAETPSTLHPMDAESQDVVTPTENLPTFAPLSRAISDIVGNLRGGIESQDTSSEGPSESRIPRLVDIARKDFSASRTQSSTGIARVPYVNSAGSSASNLASAMSGKLESSKNSLAESSEALKKRMLGSFKGSKSTHSLIPRSVPSRSPSKVSTLAKHFEQLSKEFERQRLRERHQRAAKSRQARAFPLASSKPIVEVYRDAREAVQDREAHQERGNSDEDGIPLRPSVDNSTLNDSSYTETTEQTSESQSPTDERHRVGDADTSHATDGGESVTDTSVHHLTDAEGEASDLEHADMDDIAVPDISDESQMLPPLDSSLDLSVELPKHEKSFMMKVLTNFWSERSASGWTPLDYPFAPIEHVWEDSDIIVREDEPSSIIALALSSGDYLAKLRDFRSEAKMPEDFASEVTSHTDEDNIERNLRHTSNTNIKYAFQNRGVKVQCKIFYAQSFDALRRKTGVADRFVESMSRCLKWDSKGGKTKSLFLKTLDDRFVLKQLSSVEVNAFFKFAPDYFSFTHQNLFHNLPSVIAKMFGLFQVTIRNPASGRDFDCFMLVMENLFYDRGNNLRRFDLKGSMRNRKIESTGEQDEVLLDENLVDIIFERPIFVREHTKKTLKLSVWNDTLFLSKQNVMDYSLMAGFNDAAGEIVVGIIDCIRTYTWDKKLETWIKDRGKNKPTVTSPKDYRSRFRVAMGNYILQSPTTWHQWSRPEVELPHRLSLMRGHASSHGLHQQQQQQGGEESAGTVAASGAAGEMMEGEMDGQQQGVAGF